MSRAATPETYRKTILCLVFIFLLPIRGNVIEFSSENALLSCVRKAQGT